MKRVIKGHERNRHVHEEAVLVFEELCQAMGKPRSSRVNDVGTWALDFNRAHGGYIVCEVGEDRITHPFGSRRWHTQDFINHTRAAIEAVELYKEGLNEQ